MATGEMKRQPFSGLDTEEGALMELAAWPGMAGTQRTIYLTLAIRPDMDRNTLAQIAGVIRSTLVGHERNLARRLLLDPNTRTVLYPRTGRA